jgi:hypothetical protein
MEEISASVVWEENKYEKGNKIRKRKEEER